MGMQMTMRNERFTVLDGWRAISILLVLSAHLLPLGPKSWQLNVSAGLCGMVLFFILSGFLITHMLLKPTHIADFLIRRFARILPLAWLYLALVLAIYPVSGDVWLAHILFYANYPPKPLIHVTDHFWSLCVEIHFYLGIALLVATLKKKGLLLLPLLCIGVTILRIVDGIHFSVMTHLRIDEILAGATLALIYNHKLGARPLALLKRLNPWVVGSMLLLSCYLESGPLQYLRPYFGAAIVGITLLRSEDFPALQHRLLAYIASISFALYIIHPFLVSTWLGSGDLLEKYAKRPLLFFVLFVCAHISTFYYERQWIEFGSQLSEKLKLRRAYVIR